MQPFLDLVCAECGREFDSAALLLHHFAEHVSENIFQEKAHQISTKKTLPDLYPINTKKKIMNNHLQTYTDSENAATYCEVAINEDATDDELVININEEDYSNSANGKSSNVLVRKYQCEYCTKCFGWPTDLKRHILVHTGERPFKCSQCSCSYTRNFLLQSHIAKVHSNKASHGKMKIPDLKPITSLVKRKSRKQDKCKIRKKYSELNGLKNLESLVDTKTSFTSLCS